MRSSVRVKVTLSMRLSLISALAAASLLAGCSFDSITDRITPYRIDIRQGNYVDQPMIAQLKRGMTRDQVRFVLGSPLVTDVFRTDRWDYVYRFRPGQGEVEQRVISVFFVDDRLDHIDGDVIGGDAKSTVDAQQAARTRVVEVPAAPKD
ncbi:MAG: outer membrane protein assembly factor BamE [Azoarcus sp.]|jgi:outer membrane protein assembly factor BamE|nr:outer membrane protein assembly factor BamE [Azoarcus sp.]